MLTCGEPVKRRDENRRGAMYFFDRVLRPVFLGCFAYAHLHASFVLVALKRVRARQESLSEFPDDLPSRILYLRAFGVDHDPIAFKEPFKPGALAAAPPEPKSSEEELLGYLSSLPGALCIGRPNEKFPSCGAQRIYFSDEDWKDAVGALLQTCALVLVRTAETPGLVWEITEVVSVASPERVVFWHSGGNTGWERFRILVDPILPHPLPQALKQPAFLRFRADWVPQWLSVPQAHQQGYGSIATELYRLAVKNRPSTIDGI